MTTPSERRTLPRIACDVPLIVSLEAAAGRPSRNLVGRARNVSDGGVLVVLPECLPRGTRVTLILLPSERAPDLAAISVEAQVAWSDEARDALRQCQHGFSFLSLASGLVSALLTVRRQPGPPSGHPGGTP